LLAKIRQSMARDLDVANARMASGA
jgi:hypothetical protein